MKAPVRNHDSDVDMDETFEVKQEPQASKKENDPHVVNAPGFTTTDLTKILKKKKTSKPKKRRSVVESEMASGLKKQIFHL